MIINVGYDDGNDDGVCGDNDDDVVVVIMMTLFIVHIYFFKKFNINVTISCSFVLIQEVISHQQSSHDKHANS